MRTQAATGVEKRRNVYWYTGNSASKPLTHYLARRLTFALILCAAIFMVTLFEVGHIGVLFEHGSYFSEVSR